MLEELAADPAIEYIEPNYRLYPLGTPISGDNYAANQWGLKNYGQIINGYTGVAGIDINLETAWLITQGDPDVLVAVIDTGVDISHPDLVGSMWINANEIPANGVDDDENGFIDDYCGWDFNNKDNSVFDSATEDRHGTHCSGTIAATCNLVGITGVAPGVKILPLKFMNTGGGDTADAIAAIEYARTAGAKIVNCSWGGADDSIALRDAIASSDMLFIAAAGNEGKNIDDIPLYPASFDLPNIITVAAIDNQGKLASFPSNGASSNFGPQSVDVAAPGLYIYGTLPENKYGYLSGTSMAVPHVSGIAALVASAGYTDITVIKQRILISAGLNPLPSLSGKILTGGLVDATAAAEIEMAPLASDLSIIGGLFQGETIQAAYTYFDLNGDLESDTLVQWYRTAAPDKSDGISIDGATGWQYTLTGDDLGKYIYFSVTPAAASGNSPGTTVYSDCVGPVKATQVDDCFIATAAFGSKFAPAVKMLRIFRDEYLLTNRPGRAFVAFYYRHSPPLAHYIADREGLRVLTRVLLSPFIAGVYMLYHKWLLALVLILALFSLILSHKYGRE